MKALALVPLAYLLWRPVSGGVTLYAMLALIALFSLVVTRTPAPWLVWSWLLMMAGVLLMLLVGSLRGAPGVGHQSAVWLGSPLIWYVWANSFTMSNVRRVLITVCVVTLGLSTAIVLYVGSQSGIVPLSIPEGLLKAQGAGFGESTVGATEVRFFGLSTLAAAAPLAAAGALVRRAPSLPPRWLMVVTAIMAAWAAVVGGRRAILVVTVLSPLILWCVTWLMRPKRAGAQPRRIHPGLVVAAPLLFMGVGLGWSTNWLGQFRSSLADALEIYLGLGSGSGTGGADTAIRATQAQELLRGWAELPLLGHGLGATLASGFNRSVGRPWMFELQYHQLLFDGGLIGTLIAAAAVVVAAQGVLRVARNSPEEAPTLAVCATAAIAMLVANATNPYLQAVGHWWSVTLVLGVASAVWRAAASAGTVDGALVDEAAPADASGDLPDCRLTPLPA